MAAVAGVVRVKLPDIGEGIAEGEIVEWLVSEGDTIKQFQPLVKVLTAKATVEIPSPYTGRVVRILAKPGDVVRVGEPIVEIEVEGPEAVEAGKPGAPREEPRVEARPWRPAEAARVRAPPSVRMLAKKLGVDLARVKGTGPRGVITKDDVLRAAREAAPPEAQPPALEERVELRGVRRLMAQRMAESKSRIPHAYLVEEVDVTELARLRERLRPAAEESGVRLTYLPFIVMAVAKTLRKYPLLNSSFNEEDMSVAVKKRYNIGIAVDTENGLVVPVVKDADRKGLLELAREINGLVEKARRGELGLEDVTGGTFTITNFGSIAGVVGIPVINPPEAAILGLGRITGKLALSNGRVEERKVMYITLSFDHRVVEGAYAARFLRDLKALLEDPIRILI